MSFHKRYKFVSDPMNEVCRLGFKTRTTKVRSKSRCVYCGEFYEKGDLLARASGIKSAHTDCTLGAFKEHRLVLNFIDSEQRPKELLDRSLSLESSMAALDAIGSRYSKRAPQDAFKDPREKPRTITMRDGSTRERPVIYKRPRATGNPEIKAQRLGFNTKNFEPPGNELTKCVYCRTRYQHGALIAFASGMQHGHAVCVTAAHEGRRLVLGYDGARHRPGSMHERSLTPQASWLALNAAKLSVGSVELLSCGEGPQYDSSDRDRMSRAGLSHVFAQAKDYGFRVSMAKAAMGKCVYCGEVMGPEQRVASAFGIWTGHIACSVVAYRDNRLVLDSFNAKDRDDNLLEHSLSAPNSQEVLKSHGVRIKPARMLLDDRHPAHSSWQRQVFENGAKRWPSLIEADQAAMQEWSEDQALRDRARLEHGQPSSELGEVNLTGSTAVDGDPDGALYKQMKGRMNREGTKSHPIPDEGRDIATVRQCFEEPNTTRRCSGCAGKEVCCYGKQYEEDDHSCIECKWTDECKQRLEVSGDMKDETAAYEEVQFMDEAQAEHSPLNFTAKERAEANNHCPKFAPSRICVVVMHPRMRPRGHCLREMDLRKYHELLEAQWQTLADKVLSEWKIKKHGSLPFCPEHEGRWGLKGNKSVHVSLEAKLFKVKSQRYLRELWWVCPGRPKDWDCRDRPAGFGG